MKAPGMRTVTIRRGGQMPMTGLRFADIQAGDRFRVENEPDQLWHVAEESPQAVDDENQLGVLVRTDPDDQDPARW